MAIKIIAGSLEGRMYGPCVRLGRLIRKMGKPEDLDDEQLYRGARYLWDELANEGSRLVAAFKKGDEEEINHYLCTTALCRDNMESYLEYLRGPIFPHRAYGAFRRIDRDIDFFDEKIAFLLPKIEERVPSGGKKWWEVLAPTVATYMEDEE